MKDKLITQIKELIKVNPSETIEINPNYLEYFTEDELISIINQLQYKKNEINNITSEYLTEIYEKTKKDEI
ncbi:hypothetical protein [Poseidonibacter sp.]|uniref:hypothetical protein n=1 Tax=Poseidonibacter sp. TaxID=2321188 RepID=UPI00359E78DF